VLFRSGRAAPLGGHTRDDRMDATGKGLEHERCFFSVRRLAKEPLVENHAGVGGEDEAVGVSLGHGLRFGTCQSPNMTRR
jgi:hypothetical protein